MKPVLVCRNVSKHYGRIQAVKDLDLELYPGEILGFLGPNGAGFPDAVAGGSGTGGPGRSEEVEIIVSHAGHEGLLAGWPGLLQIMPGPGDLLQTCRFQAGPEAVPSLVRDLVHKGLQVHQVKPRQHDLETLFIEKTSGGTPDVRIDSF